MSKNRGIIWQKSVSQFFNYSYNRILGFAPYSLDQK